MTKTRRTTVSHSPPRARTKKPVVHTTAIAPGVPSHTLPVTAPGIPSTDILGANPAPTHADTAPAAGGTVPAAPTTAPHGGSPAGTGSPEGTGGTEGGPTAPTAVSTGDVTIIPAGGGAPVTPTKPTVSKGLKATTGLLKPRGNQAILAPSVALEILASLTAGTYATYFGPHAPDATELANELTQAAEATQQEENDLKAWKSSRDTRNQRWNQVLSGPLETFQTCFDFAVSQNESIALHFPTTTVFLRTAQEIGKRGAATRKAKKAAKAAIPPTTG